MIEGTGQPPLPKPELHNLDPLTARVFQAFSETFYLQRQAMPRVFAGKGVHPGEAFCLRLLAKNDGITQHDLADIVHLSRPRVTKILQSLEKEGAIVRRVDESDQRLTRVSLTADGRRRESELRKILESYLSEIIGALSDADRLELERLLNVLAERITHVLHGGKEPGL